MIGIISDIHGNRAALLAVLSRLDEIGVSHIVCLGDTAGYYSQVNECCELLRGRGVFCLMGNHDWYLVSGARSHRSSSANACLDYQREVITADNLAWLASLSPSARRYGIRLAHGGWIDPLEEYVSPTEDYFGAFEGCWFASGHTHVPCIFSGGGKTWCNPGSVGQPRDGDPRASFALWDGEHFELHRVDYDIAATRQAMADAGFPPRFHENLVTGTRIGGAVSANP
tara:strand:+ start:1115 stop:1795 length:681 start_codon:yes stop_codon:yes gene_type:complete